jgi:hypothetical protein
MWACPPPGRDARDREALGRLDAAEHDESPRSLVISRGPCAVAPVARALRGRQVADACGGLEFDGSNDARSVGVPAAGVWHRDSRWTPLPNKRMKLAVGPAEWTSVTAAIQ